jgi:hypothetical protein
MRERGRERERERERERKYDATVTSSDHLILLRSIECTLSLLSDREKAPRHPAQRHSA